MSHYSDAIRTISARMKDLGNEFPEVMQGFQALSKASVAEGALSSKTKELIALALGVAARCEGCVAFHARALVKQNATRKEVAEALGVAVSMGGGPSMMWATEAMAAFDELQAKAAG